jgi:hypothetical protein
LFVSCDVQNKPVKLIGKHFPEVEIELRRKIMVVSQAPASKWRVTVPQSLHPTQKKSHQRHDSQEQANYNYGTNSVKFGLQCMIYGGDCVDQIINAASIYFDRIHSHTFPSKA